MYVTCVYWGTLMERNIYKNVAEFYDHDERELLKVDIPFFLDLAREYNCSEILELACGTGRIAIPLAKEGLSVTGLDISLEMLNIFNEKIKHLPDEISNRIRIVQGDMSNFNLNKRYDLVLFPFHTFQMLLDDKSRENCLCGIIAEHLKPNGIFVVNAFRPYGPIDENWELVPPHIQYEVYDRKNRRTIKKTSINEKIDISEQIIYVKHRYDITYEDGKTKSLYDYLALKYYQHEQLKSLLLNTGFEILEEYGWYDKRDIANGKELIFVCRLLH